MKKNYIFLSFCLLLVAACTGNDSAEKEVAPGITAAGMVPLTKTVFDLEPALANADSLQVLFYDDPDGDSLRYSRFFTYSETADTAQIRPLLRELNRVYVQQQETRACRSEGKLYLLKGEDVLKTVYFSAGEDSCRYFYFIKDGTFIYLPLTGTAADWLQKHRKVAKKP
ncbi:MAG TPA: hypothetical protein VGN63_15405 [Flavisolibacter sp.]|jgi:hypothetical protein|nr:hypothetical protein [Flavisolibacter sp.]